MTKRHTPLLFIVTGLLLATLSSPVQAQLSSAWMVPAAAHVAGSFGTFWLTDLFLHNPHEYDLPVVVQALPSNTSNLEVTTLRVTLFPYETLNLWDVFGDDLFDIWGTGALLVYFDLDSWQCDPAASCEFLVTSRTYTADGAGEYGQTIPGRDLLQGIDWWTFGYAAGVMNDDSWFRTNVGVASWSGEWITVRVDVQDAAGNILGTHELQVPPFGHVQRRLAWQVSGGAVVFYIVSGPDDALVFPYSSVVNRDTGDPSFFPAQPSVVGVSVAKNRPGVKDRPAPPKATDRTMRGTPGVAREIRIDATLRTQKRTLR